MLCTLEDFFLVKKEGPMLQNRHLNQQFIFGHFIDDYRISTLHIISIFFYSVNTLNTLYNMKSPLLVTGG